MKIQEFDYTKPNGDESRRKVMTLREFDGYIDAIDFKYLSDEEKELCIKAQNEYEATMRPLIEKSHRRFRTDRMKNFNESII